MSTTELPRWDVSTYFSGLESREFITAEEQAGAEIQRLVALYDRHEVRGTASVPTVPTPRHTTATPKECVAGGASDA